MHTNRGTVGFFAVLLMACCLVLGGFASPAAAKTIVVTTLTDTADPPFNADGPCRTGTVGNLPGEDGLISLREAIIAANNTPGADTITFSNGGAITVNFDDGDGDSEPDPLPALCGGHTRIKGDLDRDNVPDLTLEGAAFSAATSLAGIAVVSNHYTIRGLQIQHFPFGIAVVTGLTGPGTVKHTTVKNNIIAESTLDGILMVTGDAPGSVLTDTTITRNQVMNNARFGIFVLANLTAAGSDTHITHTTITDNEVRENGAGIYIQPQGAHNRLTDLTIARNTVIKNAALGIHMFGGVGEAEENTLDVRIRANTVTDSGAPGIRLIGGADNSSNNYVVARIEENTLERNPGGIVIRGGFGAETISNGTTVRNVVDVRIERNKLKDHEFDVISIFGGAGSTDGPSEAVADHNQVNALVQHNVIEGSTATGIGLAAGGSGLASENTLHVRVVHNTVCGDGTDVIGEGSLSDIALPNQGTGNVLDGDISKNTATEVTVVDGTPGNTATVRQFNNDPCP